MSIQHDASAVPGSAWIKSSYSTGGGGECVEVAASAEGIHVRDSKVLPGPVLTVTLDAWSQFLGLAADRSV